MRKGLLAVILGFIALLTGLARADNGAAENDDSRFTFHRAADGFVRLDGRSGEVSICSRRPAGWLCQLVPDERVALEGEIGRLQADNAALKKELLAHDLPLPAGIKPDARARTEEPADSARMKARRIRQRFRPATSTGGQSVAPADARRGEGDSGALPAGRPAFPPGRLADTGVHRVRGTRLIRELG